jgi:hypothetical protein
MQDENFIFKLNKYKLMVAAFLVVLLIALSFFAGVRLSCKNGYLRGFQCVQPEKVATLNVCEYNPMNCVSHCENFLIDDVDEFCKTFNPAEFK